MCGIAGYFGNNKIESELISRTLNLMRSRGPDNQNFINFRNRSGNLYLLHSRLSIIDIEKRSNQPFSKYNLTIIFNGEIYNYIELRERIKHKISSSTSSDTEIILDYYKLYGVNCLKYFEGMWSFAIYDKTENSLFISRDRFGEKPLYISHDGLNFYFGSEIKFIKSLKDKNFQINYDLVKSFLMNGYKTIFKKKETFFNDIMRVENATAIILKEGKIKRIYKYWQPKYKENLKFTPNDAIELCREKIINSVKLRLRSDAPIAFCLSGGVDSSSLVSVASKVLNYKVKTFSIIDEDPRYNETENIKKVVSDLNCEFELINLKDIDFFEKLKNLVNYHDGPISTISYLIHSLISEVASNQGFKVIVSGTGADELFTGYYDHYLYQLNEIKGTQYFEKNLKDWKKFILKNIRNQKLRDYDSFLKTNPPKNHIFDTPQDKSIFIDSKNKEFYEYDFCSNHLKNRMLNELFYEVTPVILNEDDLNSMMNSMENRSPFLDTKLFDFAYSVPVHLHIKNGYNKYLLRESMKNILNESVRLDRVKKGFNASIDSMINLKSEYIQDFILDSRSRIYDIINYKKMEKYFFNNNSETNKNVHSKFYFSFISCKLFIDQFS